MAKKLQKSPEFSAVFNNLIDICDSKNISVTTLIDKFASSRSAMTAWKNGNINTDIIPKLAHELEIPLELLFFGIEKKASLSQDELNLLEMYEMLTDMEKGEILGELKQMTKKAHIHTAEIAARSTNKEKPKTVTGDFSDILNAPDSTDDYK
nr:MAG TPA: Putative transcription factor-turn-helix, DNA binding protein, TRANSCRIPTION.95A [Caudoviricetes sp.]